MALITVPETFNIVQALEPQALGGVLTGDYVSLKGAQRVTVVVNVARGANATDLNLYLDKATGDAVGNTAITTSVAIWKCANTATTDALVRQTDAVSIATGVTQSVNQIYVFQVDCTTLGDTYDWLTLRTDASNAAHYISALYLIESRYPGKTPPTAIA